MAMVVKNNLSALNTLNILNSNTNALSKSLQKVSSGMKINNAADDASGYAISERMRVQIRSLDQAKANTENGNSMMKVAEGAVASTVEILKTLKEKAINAANDSNTDEDRATIQKELNQSVDQIDDNANVTFNGKYLVDGSKNSIGDATYTSLTNQSLATETKATTNLVDLKSRSGDSLQILETDSVTVSYVQNGKTFITSFSVANDTTLQDIFNAAEQIDDKTKVFADVTNESVYKALGPADADAAKAQMETDDKVTFGDDVAAKLLSGEIDIKAAIDTTGVAGKVKDATDKVVDGLAEAIATYNKNAGDDKRIDIGAFGDMITTDDISDPSKYKVKTDMTNSEKIKFLQILRNDKNYAAASNGNNDISEPGAAYDAFKTAYDKSLTDHTTVIASDNVGINAAGKLVTTASGDKGITVIANGEGVDGQISGLTISIADAEGNVKKSANAALDAFSESIRAQIASADNAITLQVGAKANQSIKVGLTDMRSQALGLKGADGAKLNITTQAKANAAINVLENAIQKALDQQTTIGSVESRLNYTASNLTTASENVTSAESTIRDADMAREMTEYTKNNVLMQAAQSMLAQANQNSSNVLSLLQ